MTQNDRKDFDKIIIALAEMYETILSEERLSLYFEALKDMTPEQFKESANRVARTSRFFPKPVDFRESITSKIEERAILALNSLEDAIRRYGYDKSVVFLDKVVHMAVAALDGWQAVCQTPNAEWKWKRKEFLELYRVLSANPRGTCPDTLIGFHEHQNSVRGFLNAIDKPVFIGIEKKQLK